MIVISGALVLVALVLLVLGLTMTELLFVYGSILVSLVSFVFLIIGILQRRGEKTDAPEVTQEGAAPAGDDKPAASAAGRPQAVPAVTTASGSPRKARAATAPVAAEPDHDEDELEPGGGRCW